MLDVGYQRLTGQLGVGSEGFQRRGKGCRSEGDASVCFKGQKMEYPVVKCHGQPQKGGRWGRGGGRYGLISVSGDNANKFPRGLRTKKSNLRNLTYKSNFSIFRPLWLRPPICLPISVGIYLLSTPNNLPIPSPSAPPSSG